MQQILLSSQNPSLILLVKHCRDLKKKDVKDKTGDDHL